MFSDNKMTNTLVNRFDKKFLKILQDTIANVHIPVTKKAIKWDWTVIQNNRKILVYRRMYYAKKNKQPISILPIIHNTCKPMTNIFIQINSNAKIQYK